VNIVNNQLLGDLVTLSVALYVVVLAWAIYRAPWKSLTQHPERLHIFLGTCVLLMLLWKLRAGVSPGLDIHFLGMTALTLIAGWQMAIIGSGLVLAGVSLFTEVDWFNFPVNALLTGVIPVLATLGMLRLASRFLPKHFFIYIYINAFLGGMVAITATSLVAAGMLWVSGEYDFSQLSREYLAYLPLLAFPEGFVNGMVMTGLVVLRPEWVATFDDELYLKGK
jgi:uncharacterized membrane protein